MVHFTLKSSQFRSTHKLQIFAYGHKSKVRNKNHKVSIKVNIKAFNFQHDFQVFHTLFWPIKSLNQFDVTFCPVWTTLNIEYHPGFFCYAFSIRVKSFVMYIVQPWRIPRYMVLRDPGWPLMTIQWPLLLKSLNLKTEHYITSLRHSPEMNKKQKCHKVQNKGTLEILLKLRILKIIKVFNRQIN